MKQKTTLEEMKGSIVVLGCLNLYLNPTMEQDISIETSFLLNLF